MQKIAASGATTLSRLFVLAFSAGVPGVFALHDVHNNLERLELMRAGDVLDTYTPADLEAGRTLGLYEQLHTLLVRESYTVNLYSVPDAHPSVAHTVQVTRGGLTTRGDGASPVFAVLRAAIEHRQKSRTPPGLGERLRWAWQDSRSDRREQRSLRK